MPDKTSIPNQRELLNGFSQQRFHTFKAMYKTNDSCGTYIYIFCKKYIIWHANSKHVRENRKGSVFFCKIHLPHWFTWRIQLMHYLILKDHVVIPWMSRRDGTKQSQCAISHLKCSAPSFKRHQNLEGTIKDVSKSLIREMRSSASDSFGTYLYNWDNSTWIFNQAFTIYWRFIGDFRKFKKSYCAENWRSVATK